MSERNTSILQNVAARERTILKNVYLWMTAGLGLTALIAFFVASNPHCFVLWSAIPWAFS